MAKKQVFEYFFNRLVNGYRSVMGKNPEGLDLIKIKQEARQKTIDQDKIIKFPQPKSFGQEIDEMIKKGEVNIGEAPKTKSYTPSKSQTDFEIQERLNSDNKKAIKAFEERIKNKPLDPDDVLPNYNETPGEYSRRKTPGSKENLLEELKIAYEKEFNRLRGDETAEELKEILKNLDTDGVPFASGGRAGYYGGGQAMVGEDLSEIGHGADALMARNMQLSPNGQATTSTGLNYLLGQDNETVRVPYNEGNMVLPKAKPTQSPLVELSRIYKTYEDAMPGVSKDTQQYLQQDFIQKLQDAGISQEAFMTYKMQNNFADGGRIGYAGGKGVDIARRGFLKILGGSVAAATAFKMGLVKMLGKESGAVSKKAVDEFFASGTSGAPTWFEPLVNKALKEGLDITEKAAVKDGQIVKSLDTPTGKVDVTYDTRTGAVDIDYMGGDTAMGEGLQMRYAPGEIIEEGANMGKKSDDVFEAVESIPEYDNPFARSSHKELMFGENTSSNVDDLYSNTSELAELGGQKLLIKDISKSIQKKKFLKKMDDDPDQFAMENAIANAYYD